jgi:hypothetical protein
MSWFGWLTKPQLMVSFLDRAIMVCELSVVIYVVVMVWYYVGQIRKRAKNGKK